MKTARLTILFALVLALSIASGAWAVDEGQTQPRLNNQPVSPNSSVNIIPLTSGSGNIKGFQCMVYNAGATFWPTLRLHFYVDGGAAQTIDPSLAIFHADAEGNYYTDVPMNIRFGTSIKVTLQKLTGSNTASAACAVSWGLD